MRLPTIAWLAPWLLACSAPCHPPAGADDTFRVHVVAADGTPLPQATFTLDGAPMPMICEDDSGEATTTCPSARWRQGIVGAHHVGVAASGYAPSSITVDTGSYDNCGETLALHKVTATVQLAAD